MILHNQPNEGREKQLNSHTHTQAEVNFTQVFPSQVFSPHFWVHFYPFTVGNLCFGSERKSVFRCVLYVFNFLTFFVG